MPSKKFLFFCFFLSLISVFLFVVGCDQSKKPSDTPKVEKNETEVSDKKDESTIRICDWYGKFFPICNNILEGWGWENNESCIGIDSCENAGGISLDFSKD